MKTGHRRSVGERVTRLVDNGVISRLGYGFVQRGLPLRGRIRNLLPRSVKGWLRVIRRQLQLTPMKQVLTDLEKRNVRLNDLHALEVFGCSGDGHVKDYAAMVSTLEIWEIDQKFEEPLKKHFPYAAIKITDSYEEIKRTSKRYNFIVVDNGTSTRGRYCEHFDLFPDIFRIAMDSSVLIINVIPEIDETVSRDYPYLFNENQLERRRVFYKTERPEKVTFDQMEEVYRELSRANGFNLEWHLVQQRNFIYYLVLKLKCEPQSSV